MRIEYSWGDRNSNGQKDIIFLEYKRTCSVINEIRNSPAGISEEDDTKRIHRKYHNGR